MKIMKMKMILMEKNENDSDGKKATVLKIK